MKYKLLASVVNAASLARWIRHRAGVAVWRSANPSNPDGQWLTPATINGKPFPKPDFQCAQNPKIVTNPDHVGLSTDKEVIRFRVGVDRSSFPALKIINAGMCKIRAAVSKAGDGAFYRIDYFSQEGVILVPDKIISLSDWIRQKQN
jgi:hypothetical protein